MSALLGDAPRRPDTEAEYYRRKWLDAQSRCAELEAKLEKSAVDALVYQSEIERLTAEKSELEAENAALREALGIAVGAIKEICAVRNIPMPTTTLKRAEAVLSPQQPAPGGE